MCFGKAKAEFFLSNKLGKDKERVEYNLPNSNQQFESLCSFVVAFPFSPSSLCYYHALWEERRISDRRSSSHQKKFFFPLSNDSRRSATPGGSSKCVTKNVWIEHRTPTYLLLHLNAAKVLCVFVRTTKTNEETSFESTGKKSNEVFPGCCCGR